MKYGIYLLLLLILLPGRVPAQSGKISRKEQQKIMLSGAIAHKMLHKNIVIRITNVISSLNSKTVQNGYPFTLVNDEFSCMLPFSGKSSIAPYGSGSDTYIVSEKQKVTVTSTFNQKKGYYDLLFSFENKNDKEYWDVSAKIFITGKVSVNLTSGRKSPMQYLGEIIL